MSKKKGLGVFNGSFFKKFCRMGPHLFYFFKGSLLVKSLENPALKPTL